MEALMDFLFLGFKITADGNFSDEIERCLPLGMKAMMNLDNELKNRDSTLLTNIYKSKLWFFQFPSV